MLCCNRHENGMFAGKLFGVRFRDDDGEITLDCVEREPICDFDLGARPLIRISRKLFPIQSYSEWVGNWCWNQVTTDQKTGMEIFDYIVSLKKFSPDSAEGETWMKRWDEIELRREEQ